MCVRAQPSPVGYSKFKTSAESPSTDPAIQGRNDGNKVSEISAGRNASFRNDRCADRGATGTRGGNKCSDGEMSGVATDHATPSE